MSHKTEDRQLQLTGVSKRELTMCPTELEADSSRLQEGGEEPLCIAVIQALLVLSKQHKGEFAVSEMIQFMYVIL